MDHPAAGLHGGLLLGATLALGLIGSAYVVSRSYEKVKLADQSVRVKGIAQKKIRSDWAVWTGSFTARGKEQAAAYDKLQADLARVLEFLDKAGMKKEEIEVSPVATRLQYALTDKGDKSNEIERYILEQTVKVSSSDVDRVARAARESTSLLKAGVELASGAPQFLCTGVDAMKIDMLGEATKDARARAEKIAVGSGGAVGALKSASQGVFQITPPHSTDVSDSGEYDTTSIDKVIKAIVTVEYAVR